MRLFVIIIASFALTLGSQATAQPPTKAEPLGIWRATLDGVPSAILTLADDSGEIGGTLVLNGVDHDSRTIAVTEVHTLVHPRFEGRTLTFQVRRPDATLMTFNVAFTSATRAKLHCLNCGADAPVAELTKDPL